MTSGVRESVGLAARLFLHRGTTAVIEDPCAADAALVFGATGSEVVGVGVDAEGLIPEKLPQRPAALLYLTPSHQFPTGTCCRPSAATRSRPGRGAAAVTFSKTIPTASSVSMGRR